MYRVSLRLHDKCSRDRSHASANEGCHLIDTERKMRRRMEEDSGRKYEAKTGTSISISQRYCANPMTITNRTQSVFWRVRENLSHWHLEDED